MEFSEGIFGLDPEEENEFYFAITISDTREYLAISTIFIISPAEESAIVTVTSTVSRVTIAPTGTALKEETSGSGQGDKLLYIGLLSGLGAILLLFVAGAMIFLCLRWRSARLNKDQIELRNFALPSTGIMIQQPLSRMHAGTSAPGLKDTNVGEEVSSISNAPAGANQNLVHPSRSSELSG